MVVAYFKLRLLLERAEKFTKNMNHDGTGLRAGIRTRDLPNLKHERERLDSNIRCETAGKVFMNDE